MCKQEGLYKKVCESGSLWGEGKGEEERRGKGKEEGEGGGEEEREDDEEGGYYGH